MQLSTCVNIYLSHAVGGNVPPKSHRPEYVTKTLPGVKKNLSSCWSGEFRHSQNDGGYDCFPWLPPRT